MDRRLCGLLRLAACALAAAGCGGGTSASGVRAEPIGSRELASSASTSAEASSGRFSFSVSLGMTGADEAFALSGEGAFDRASNRSSLSVDMSSLAKLLGGLAAGFGATSPGDLPDFDDPAGWKLEVVNDGNVDYVRLPAVDEHLPAGKTWIRGSGGRIDAAGLGLERLSFTNGDPRDLLEALRAVSGAVETVGTEVLRGVETTHYRAEIDPAKVVAAGSGTAGLLDRVTSLGQVKTAPIDVWIDGDGLVRKALLDITATQAGSADEGHASMAFELWDYGEDVRIEPPPASEVVDATALRG